MNGKYIEDDKFEVLRSHLHFFSSRKTEQRFEGINCNSDEIL